ncbi:MAG: TraR/DksA family transcriptional regulator [Marmoricola sp.]|nr:TraR/DksA family transcriptional regulator [Marmoricola sp.]
MGAATRKQATSPATPAVEKRAATTPASGAATSTSHAAITTPAKKASVENMTTQTTPATPAAPDLPTTAASAADLPVLDREDPWTAAEVASVRDQLVDDVERLAGELAEVEGDLAGMIENSGEGAGHDQADVGSASFERDQEMVIVHNARDMLEQSQHALERIADGTYGACEVCGQAIGKNRLMAFPRATLCLKCKQREERR